MPRVVFTANLERHVPAPAQTVPGGTVGEALEAVFAANPRLRGYILDEQGRLRRHVVVFVDGARLVDTARLGDPLREDSEVYVMQALSGG
jgi:molybdopterin converting factor small subunit